MSLKIGSIFSANVIDIASDGRAVIRHESGQIFFCAGVWLGEQGQFKVTEFKGRHGVASLVELSELSPHRVEAFCKHHGFTTNHCGGCAWQFIDYAEQLNVKQARVLNEFTRLLENLKPSKKKRSAPVLENLIKPILASPKLKAYRNRAQFKSDGHVIGYLAAASNQIVAIEQCPILSEHNQNTLNDLISTMPKREWQQRQKRGQKPKWTSIDIDESVDAATASINERLPFRQANSDQNQNMRQWLLERLSKLDKNKKVLELFCGAGNFTEIIAQCGFSSILAVEAVEPALNALKQKKLPNVKLMQCDLFEENGIEKIVFKQPDSNILVLDPPREGLKVKRGLLPKKHQIEEVFYISCNIATLVRDLQFFIEGGFEIAEVQALDQFPHTPHFELLCHLVRP